MVGYVPNVNLFHPAKYKLSFILLISVVSLMKPIYYNGNFVWATEWPINFERQH